MPTLAHAGDGYTSPDAIEAVHHLAKGGCESLRHQSQGMSLLLQDGSGKSHLIPAFLQVCRTKGLSTWFNELWHTDTLPSQRARKTSILVRNGLSIWSV